MKKPLIGVVPLWDSEKKLLLDVAKLYARN